MTVTENGPWMPPVCLNLDWFSCLAATPRCPAAR